MRAANAIALVRCVALLVSLSAFAACQRSAPEPVAQAAAKPAAVVAPQPAPVADAGPPMRLYASKFVSKIRSAPSKEAPRIGYLRGGAVLSAKTRAALGFTACRKGWFELQTGGFVCSTTDVIAFEGKRLPDRRPTQPVFDQPLPYPYGYSRSKNTPVYKHLPTDEEAALYEGYRIPGAASPVTDAGVLVPPVVVDAAVAQAAPAPEAAGEPGEGAVDAGPPTLDSLKGEEGSVLVRRMERGFYVSLDREIAKGPRRYWQTQAAGYIPEKRLLLVKGTEFHGVDLQVTGTALPIAFVLSSKTTCYAIDDKGRLRAAGKPGYHYTFPVASEVEIKGRRYLVGPDGRHCPERDVTRVAAREKPKEVRDDEKWIDVDLALQSLVAYVGARPVYVTLVSTGRLKDELDPLRNFATPTGAFRITSKHVTATMDGDHALDGPYSIEDVPYVMYFELAYALHSAFWHNVFGRPKSHGCVNVAPIDAKWLFFFTDPPLPQSWHGVFPDARTPGTRLYIHGETPKG